MSVGYPQEAGPKGLVEGLIGVRKGQRLSRREVQHSIERLFATGRYSDVVVRQSEVPGGVALLFDITLKRTLASVSVEGERVLTPAEVLQAAKLSQGAEYYPERLDEAERAVTAVYNRRGYDHASVHAELEEADQGLDVVIQVAEGEPTLISALTFGGGPGLPPAQLLTVLRLNLGDVLNLDSLDAGVERLRALYRGSRFYRARIGDPVVERTGKGAAVFVPISAGPQYTVEFHGNRRFSGKLLQGTLNYDGTETLDRALMARLARRVANFYRYRGFYEAAVTAHETDNPNHQRALLVFEVDEGRSLFVEEVLFEGNTQFSAADLREVLTERVRAKVPSTSGDIHPTDDPLDLEGRTRKPSTQDNPEPAPAALFVDEAYLEAATLMEQAYRDRGFLGATVQLGEVRIDTGRRTVSVRFKVHEGPKTLVGDIETPGAPAGVDVVSVLGLRTGDVLVGGALDRARTNMARALGRAGFLFSRVDANAEMSADGRVAKLVFRVEPGTQVRVGKIIIQGTTRTKEADVRANLKIHEDAVLDAEALYESQRNLVLLSDFRQVGIRLIAPDTSEPVKDVVVELKEAPRLTYEVGGGYTLVDGPLAQGDLTFPNVLGSETDISARVKVSYVGASALAATGIIDPAELTGLRGFGARASLAVQHPLIYDALNRLPGRLGWRVDLVGERVFRPSYHFYRGALVSSLEWTYQPAADPREQRVWARFLQSGRYALTFQVEPEYDVVRAPSGIQQVLPQLTPADQARLRFPVGNFLLWNARAAPTVDFRDDPANPHRGIVLSAPTEITGAFSAVLTDANGNPIPNGNIPILTAKVSGNVTGYLPLGPRVVLALSARAGKIFRIDPASETIAPKRFFLGGTASMRGFSEDGLIPQDRRQDFAAEVQACNALANHAGCTPAAQVLLGGNQLASEGGELFELGKAELRFPLSSAFDLGLFFEAGNLWLQQSRWDPLALRYVAGGGIRYPTPIGPIAFDVGFNLLRDQVMNEPIGNVNFSVGLF